MEQKDQSISRRDFLKLASGVACVLFFYPYLSLIDKLQKNLPDREDLQTLEIKSILEGIRPLIFDKSGNLRLVSGEKGENLQVPFFPTSRKERRLVDKVRLIVVHYDAGPRYTRNGRERNALDTVNALNSNDSEKNGTGPSVHWCIDSFEIKNNDDKEKLGYGILQSQIASGDPKRPYRGRHVSIDPKADNNRILTASRFVQIGVQSNLIDIVNKKITDFDGLSVGFEQIGNKFEEGFPKENQPPARQIANTLSLVITLMKQFDLSPWDVVGHNEIQQKSDPGDCYMATLRTLLGVASLEGIVPKDLVFKGVDEKKYFENVSVYLKVVDRYNKYYGWLRYIDFYNLINPNNRYFLGLG